MQVTTIGVDLAKNVFQIHGITAAEEVVFNKPLRRAQFLSLFAKLEPCLIGMEACSSAHQWARGPADPADVCKAIRQTGEVGRH